MDMIEYLWDNEVFIDDNTLSVNVTRLRGKLADIGVTDFIETKRGNGVPHMKFSEYIKDKILILAAAPPVCNLYYSWGSSILQGITEKRSCTDSHFLVDHPWDMDCDRILSQEEIF